MKFDPSKLPDASLNQLTTALINAVGPLIDSATTAEDRARATIASAIANQIDIRVRGRSLPEE